MPEDLYFIVCLRHKNTLGGDFLLLWGPDFSGYTANIYKAGLYTKKDAEKICTEDDVPLLQAYLNLSLEDLKPKNNDVWSVVFNSQRTARWIKQQQVKFRIKERFKRRALGYKNVCLA